MLVANRNLLTSIDDRFIVYYIETCMELISEEMKSLKKILFSNRKHIYVINIYSEYRRNYISEVTLIRLDISIHCRVIRIQSSLEKKESRFNDLYFFPEMFTMLFQISRVLFQESRLSFVWCLG